MTRTGLILRYGAFAGLAMLANLATQRAVLGLWPGPEGAALVPAMAAGTGVGLVVKYILDKRWIFGDDSRGVAAHGRKFALYTLMGGATTAIFWGSETAAWLIWRSDLAREAGAAAGLIVGYVVKYRLDRRFVFGARPGTGKIAEGAW